MAAFWQITKPRVKHGQIADKGGKLEVTLVWKDAPAFYMALCHDKKDKYEPGPFFDMYEVTRVDAGDL